MKLGKTAILLPIPTDDMIVWYSGATFSPDITKHISFTKLTAGRNSNFTDISLYNYYALIKFFWQGSFNPSGKWPH